MFITASITGHTGGLVILYCSSLGMARFQINLFFNLLINYFNNYVTVNLFSNCKNQPKNDENVAILMQRT